MNTIMIDPDGYYTIKEVANYLRVSRKTVYQWTRNGKLKPTKVAGVLVRLHGADILNIIEA